MSIEYCPTCNKQIDTDYNESHFEEHEDFKGITVKPVDWQPRFKNQNDFLGWIMGEEPIKQPKVKKVDITK